MKAFTLFIVALLIAGCQTTRRITHYNCAGAVVHCVLNEEGKLKSCDCVSDEAQSKEGV